MNSKPAEGWIKHADFIILDLIVMQVAFVCAYWVNHFNVHAYSVFSYRILAVVFGFSQVVTAFFTNNYSGILKRGYYREIVYIIRYEISVAVIALAFLFAVHMSTVVSRLQFGFTLVFFLLIDYPVRLLNKRRILNQGDIRRKDKDLSSLVVITSGRLVDEAFEKLSDPNTYHPYFLSGFMLMDGDYDSIKGDYGLPIVNLDRKGLNRLREKWVDHVLILQPSDILPDKELFNALTDMGITFSFSLALASDWPPVHFDRLGEYRVITSSMRPISFRDAFLKRTLDIIGAIFGCLITAAIFIFVAPAIYIESPGPIFFKQKRVGLNGRIFDMYKFRTMYLDAEERKAALMEQNKIKDGLMFKIDDDPRIIGSEKKDKNGKPKGIGNFLRSSSLDEFPQFFNVLKGEMSLVGTRPPLLEEWENYDLHHRARMTIKPGITGLWQISGRSEITDFEEVVKLDKQYIENWSVAEDIGIILKTIVAVAKRKGAR